AGPHRQRARPAGAGRRLPAAAGAAQPDRQRDCLLALRRGDRAAGRGGWTGRAPAGGRPRRRHPGLCARTGVRTLLFAGAARQRAAQFRPGPAIRAGSRAPARWTRSVDVREGGGTVASLWLPSGAPGQRPRR
ncbi:hypothetical protein SM139_1960, partial [Stenotrophomonas maltophilia]